jgi:hypothetical protein
LLSESGSGSVGTPGDRPASWRGGHLNPEFIGEFTSVRCAHYIAGHFVTIEYPLLALDAVGSMGVYYLKTPGDIVCSSSVALSEVGALPIEGRRLVWKRGMNWDPLPSSRIPGLRKLFCDQVLNLESGAVEHRPRHIRSDI